MTNFSRYAIYYAPPEGPLAELGARWLGWDPAAGQRREHPAIAGLPRPVDALTETPRKYGLHGTLKPPFRLAPGSDLAALRADLAAFASTHAAARADGLALARLGGFLALVPEGDPAEIAALAGEIVSALDHHRAPPKEAELERRLAAGLSERQEAMLARWGYPYVMDEFRFHITLTGRLNPDEAEAVKAALAPVLAPLLLRPFVIGDLALFGEDEAGMFHLIERFALSG
jgi:putative phosphonate metabolism protein